MLILFYLVKGLTGLVLEGERAFCFNDHQRDAVDIYHHIWFAGMLGFDIELVCDSVGVIFRMQKVYDGDGLFRILTRHGAAVVSAKDGGPLLIIAYSQQFMVDPPCHFFGYVVDVLDCLDKYISQDDLILAITGSVVLGRGQPCVAQFNEGIDAGFFGQGVFAGCGHGEAPPSSFTHTRPVRRSCMRPRLTSWTLNK